MPVNKLERFSGRASFYARHRPGYPDTVIRLLERRAGWRPEARIADIGAGTGISSELFLRHGNAVSAVEPNADMRAEAAGLQAAYPEFQLVDGVAEETRLPGGAFDFVVAATAFHWFDAARCRPEFERILRPGGQVVLLWNLYRPPVTPFVREFEALAARYGDTNRHCWGRERHNITKAAAQLFGGRCATRYLDNKERLDFEALTGRLLSASYVPRPGDDRCEPMVAELRALFDTWSIEDFVELEYQTAVFYGELAGS